MSEELSLLIIYHLQYVPCLWIGFISAEPQHLYFVSPSSESFSFPSGIFAKQKDNTKIILSQKKTSAR